MRYFASRRRPKLEQVKPEDEFQTPVTNNQNGAQRLGRDTISIQNRRGSVHNLTVDSTTGALLLITPSPPQKPKPSVKPESAGKTHEHTEEEEKSQLNISVSDLDTGVTQQMTPSATSTHSPSAGSTHGHGPPMPLTSNTSVASSNALEMKVPDNNSFTQSTHLSFDDSGARDPASSSPGSVNHLDSFPALMSANALALSGPPPLESSVRSSGPPPLERPISAKGGFKGPSRTFHIRFCLT